MRSEGPNPSSNVYSRPCRRSEGSGGRGPAPVREHIRLTKTAIAGTGHPGVECFASELNAGASVLLVCEPKNAHDPRAISLRNAKGKRLGYVPKACNEILAALLDSGKQLGAGLIKTESGTIWPELRIEISLMDE